LENGEASESKESPSPKMKRRNSETIVAAQTLSSRQLAYAVGKEKKVISDPQEALKTAKKNSVLGEDLANTVWIKGVPIRWSESFFLKKIAAHFQEMGITTVSCQKDFKTDYWVLSVTTPKEAQSLIGLKFTMKDKELEIVGLHED